MTRCLPVLGVLALVMWFAGCAAQVTTDGPPVGRAGHMRDLPADMAIALPDPGRATVVFLRPSVEGDITASSVYQLGSGGDRFVGIVYARRKLAFVTDPGKTRFMVISEAADFMDAELAPGKTYYVLVVPHGGTWKTGFVLQPVRAADPGTTEVAECLKGCRLVENTDASHTWATRHWSSIQAKKAKALPEWEAKADRPTLGIADGR